MIRTAAFLIFAGLLLAQSASAVDEAGERYISKLANGGASSIRSAAESMYHTHVDDREVLDVAAEVLLTNYEEKASNKSYMDALSWVCKAIGQSGDSRYYSTLTTVSSNADNRSLKKHCKKAHKKMSDVTDEPYQQGSVNLAQYQKEAEPTDPEMDLLSAEAKEALAAGKHPFDTVREGMSMEEVTFFVGQPNITTGQVTGKAWIPFYKGGDTSLMVSIYKGLGRIVYDRDSAYSQTWRVMEISKDAAETGYP